MQEMGVEAVLEHVNVPSYLIDTSGVVRWLNLAAEKIVGDVRGRQFTSVVAPEDARRARELFARKVVGADRVTDAGVAIVGADGGRVAVEVSSVPVFRGEHVVGVFGQVSDLVEEPHAHPDLNLTRRALTESAPVDLADPLLLEVASYAGPRSLSPVGETHAGSISRLVVRDCRGHLGRCPELQ